MARCVIQFPCNKCGWMFDIIFMIEYAPQTIAFYCTKCNEQHVFHVHQGGKIGNRIDNSINQPD